MNPSMDLSINHTQAPHDPIISHKTPPPKHHIEN